MRYRITHCDAKKVSAITDNHETHCTKMCHSVRALGAANGG